MRARIAIGLMAVLSPALVSAQISTPLDETGQIERGGRAVSYRIRRLPVSSFPEVPAALQLLLEARGCMIPQTFNAHRPENLIHGSLERPGSSDWALLCSARGTVSLLVYFASSPGELKVLAEAPETSRLEVRDLSGALGFAWGIDPVSPEQAHQAQGGLTPRPPRTDHDALADQLLDQTTIYRYFTGGAWTRLPMPD